MAETRRQKSLNPFRHEPVPPRYLSNLNKYQYSGVDHSLCARFIMQHYWSNLVKLVPKTIAPNALTLMGFISCMSSALLLFYFYLSGEPEPQWIWTYTGIAVFVYQTFDALDGKQARRTKTGSPMGELFDHGCDAFYLPLMTFASVRCMGMTPWQGIVHILLCSTGMGFTLWEQFCTGTLNLGYVNGPTEGMLWGIGVFLITGHYSVDFWTSSFASPLQFEVGSFSFLLGNLRDVSLVLCWIAAIGTILSNFFNVLTKKKLYSGTAIILAAFPLSLMFILIVLLIHIVPESYNAPSLALALAYAWNCSLLATRMTVARLCQVPFWGFSLSYVALFIFSLVTLVSHFTGNYDFSKHLASSGGIWLCVIVVTQYLHTILALFSQFAQFLHINILTMTEKQLEFVRQQKCVSSQ